jgi:hypothetical protein
MFFVWMRALSGTAEGLSETQSNHYSKTKLECFMSGIILRASGSQEQCKLGSKLQHCLHLTWMSAPNHCTRIRKSTQI